MIDTPVSQIPEIAHDVRATFGSRRTMPIAFRKKQLWALSRLLHENTDAILAAVQADLRKPAGEARLSEIGLVLSDIDVHLKHMDEWTKPEPVEKNLTNKMNACEIRQDPLGCVLILGAWNYPVQLVLLPLVGAISSGCCAVMKPSELAPASAQLVAELVPQYMDSACYRVVNGGIAQSQALLAERWDKILYTGGGGVGRVVMAAAAKHLTPVVLELGGKSPVIVDKDVDLRIVARRVAWGRFANAGQTCIAPDYVLCRPEQHAALVKEIKIALNEFFGDNPQDSPDYARVVNARHFGRIKSLISDKGLGGGRVVLGGQTDASQNFIAPTVVLDAPASAPVMQEEIFGPVLPILPIRDVDEAVAFVNSRDKPLALYLFTNNKTEQEKVLTHTSSGAAVVNDTLIHAILHSLPFGGVGASGMGAYHGKHSFDMFTHNKAVIVTDLGFEAVQGVRYPPYSDNKSKLLDLVAVSDPTRSTFQFAKGLAQVGIDSIRARL